MEKKKKWGIVLLILAFLFLMVGGVMIFYDEEGKDLKEKGAQEKEMNIVEVKQYLQEHWDDFHIDGSTSMVPLHRSLNGLFSANQDEVQHSKTVDSFEKLISGENDLLLGVRYSDALLDKAKKSGVDLVQKEITREGFVFLIHESNPVKSLTGEQIKEIYSGKITNWKEVGGPDETIRAYQRNDDSGSQIRMNKFMGKMKLMDKTYVADDMGELVLAVAGFDNVLDQQETKYAIGYNMYTFIEKQYLNNDVALLSVNGVQPTDETIFDAKYPLVIYNYMYYDQNNQEASKFAKNLHYYLMSEEGQEQIGKAGYVNLNQQYDRNQDAPSLPADPNDASFDFYNEEKGEFYALDDEKKLNVFHNYADFVLRDSKYKDHSKVREYLTMLFDSGVITSRIYIDEEKGTISLWNYWFDSSLDPDDFFHVKYQDRYYRNLVYDIPNDKYVLDPFSKEEQNDALSESRFAGWPIETAATERVELVREQLKEVSLKTRDGREIEQFSDLKFLPLQ